MAYAKGFFIGSENDKGEHLRDVSGWPFSIYRRNDEIGGSDAVLCHGIQNGDDAARLLALCNGAEAPAPHVLSLFRD